jgi:translation elongation factor EF-Tu-like GTPase
MPVSSIFYMRDRGIVLAGAIRSGTITIGQRVIIASPNKSKRAVVAGVERIGTREFVDTAKSGDEIAILCRDVLIEDISDGVERVDAMQWKVLDVTVRSSEVSAASWWKRLWQR